ncbi:hypothetical protein BN7_4630 [Wickerhamomyces ciferrii]|uniref:Nitrogen permease regulator 3 n=1 Tax=Wickerhamomyces ciferrii (strain ATCC 14091 / BCRC 22168 / CBS 111 / JCM 3599 / NBRC 0793 / NRRL Y-1031 F-60-10) TaxID=1206466 RepID=K0KSM9_WICCF|nr:uncharacterized protein BN7_4630 [Wickerhamomyces ciferrii]CCH45052.1 hypothetical protein BN7_4630 [Wickerhamomyces ciferrii]
MSYYLPNPCLQGILLTISTHNGPQLVYHYPPIPSEVGFNTNSFTTNNDLLSSEDSTTDSSESDSSDEEDRVTSSHKGKDAFMSRFNATENQSSGQTLLDLLDERDKRREVKKKRRQNQKRKKGSISSNSIHKSTANSETNSLATAIHPQQQLDKVFGFDAEFLGEFLSPPKRLCNSRFELTVDDMAFLGLPIHKNDDGLWRNHKSKRDQKSKHSGNTSGNNTRSGSTKGESETEDATSGPEVENIQDEKSNFSKTENDDSDSNSMEMFHVVFVMNPSLVEYNYRLDEMFHYVVSRLSLILRYEQSKSNYVWDQVKKILMIKDNNENLSVFDLYQKLNTESSLAKVLSQCFDSIASSDIANLEINNKVISLQIPMKNQFSSLLPKTTPVLPGSYLSSTTQYDEEELDSNVGHMALLLLDAPEKIITDLKTEPMSPLSTFIKNINPMMSMNKLALLNQLDINQVKAFANHLIYWRRARSIIPLQAKSVFIVSPMAPIEYINEDMKSFRHDFPSLPSLPSFISLISTSKPRQYSAIIPSRDHRDLYLEALAWLIRHGYVTQLMTFVWLKISNRIKLAVEEDLEKEGISKEPHSKLKLTDLSTDNTSKDPNSESAQIDKSETESRSSEQRVTYNGTEVDIEEEEEEDTILLDPERATAVERRWISKCIKGQPTDIIALFHKMLKYLNGKTPLELVVVRENISRHDLKRLLNAIGDHIISVKHW